MTDNTGGKFTEETACLPGSEAQSLMPVDGGLIDSQCFRLVVETPGHIDVAGRVLSQSKGCSRGVNSYRWGPSEVSKHHQ